MEILGTRSLESAVRGRPVGSVGKIREVHHFVARCYARGMKPPQIAALINRTPATVRNYLNAPANANLVAQYEKEHYAGLDNEAEYTSAVMKEARTLAIEEIRDRLADDDTRKELKFRELAAVAGDFSDRTGLAKTSVTAHVTLNMGEKLDAARAMKDKMLEARIEGNVVKLVRRF